jgi:hypothetical protein
VKPINAPTLLPVATVEAINERSGRLKKEDEDLKKISQWKWMIAGGVVVLAWLISNVNMTVLAKLFGG